MNEKFEKLTYFGSFISKSYAKDILWVLYTYHDVSASEAATRLGLHINTVQEFMEPMYKSDIISREEVSEKKRPHFRYKLNSNKIIFNLDLDELFKNNTEFEQTDIKIREHKKSSATFSRAKGKLSFSNVIIFIGKGRERKEKRINLTNAQGLFLYNLPFPDGHFQSVAEIMKKAAIADKHIHEIIDLTNLLIDYNVIEKKSV